MVAICNSETRHYFCSGLPSDLDCQNMVDTQFDPNFNQTTLFTKRHCNDHLAR